MTGSEGVVVSAFIGVASLYEWWAGKYADGRKTAKDWQISILCSLAMLLVQRPLVYAGIFLLLGVMLPAGHESLRWIDQQYFWPGLIGFILIEEFLHGLGHWFSHTRRPRARWLQVVQAFYKISHRPHHFAGGNDGRGQLSATQTFVEHWGWWFIMPNYWFQFAALYFGLYEIALTGMVFKGLWSAHNHTNWNYDLYFLNHSNVVVRKITRGLAHIFVFPTTHHLHHSRGPTSAKNLHNLLAIYDWLIYRTLVIPEAKPEVYGWRQSPEEEKSVLYRFFNTRLGKYL